VTASRRGRAAGLIAATGKLAARALERAARVIRAPLPVLYHVSIIALSAAIAASLPVTFSFAAGRLLAYWSVVQNERLFLISTEVLVAFLLILVFNHARTNWKNRTLSKMARAAGMSDFIKVEVVGDEDTLLPDPQGTLEATRQLVKEGFIVMAYTSDDVVQAIRLYEAGAAAVMPGAAPIGTTLGLQNLLNLQLIVSKVKVPVIVDAGLGVPSEAARCLELGAAAVLVNTAIARAQDPPEMARAFAEAVVAGRRAFNAGRAHIGLKAVASSPVEGIPV